MTVDVFTRAGCPECPAVAEHCAARFECRIVACETEEGLSLAREKGVTHTPTAIFYDDEGREAARAHSLPEIRELEKRGLLQVEVQSLN